MTMQIRATGAAAPEQLSSAAHERRASVRNLAQALKAGDLGAASDAYASLASKAPQRAARNPDGPFAQVGAALAAGDLATARSAFASIFTSHLPDRTEQHPVPPSSDPSTATAVRAGTGGRLDVTA